MRVLGLETSGDVTGVGLVDERGVLAEISFRHGQQLSRLLQPCLQQLLRMAGLRFSDLDGVAVSVGPGSFTGLRIGVTAAKSLAFAAGLPVVGVSTLEALAAEHPAPEGSSRWAVLTAAKTDVFAAGYEWRDGCPQCREAPAVISIEELGRRLATAPQAAVVARVSADQLRLLAPLAPGRVLLVSDASPCPATVAAQGRLRLLAGEADPVHLLAPRYLLLSAAEAKRRAAVAS